MAILIDTKGLLRGKRLRRCSLMARLYYPVLLGMSNFYARLERDAEALTLDLAILKDQNLNDNVLDGYFDEYVKADLCLPYEAKGSTWLQFDTRVSLRRQFASAEDNASPVPPEPAYTDWLKRLHGEEWQEYNLSERQQTLSDKRAENGRAGGRASGNVRRKQNAANGSKLNGASANEAVDADVADVVVGADVGDGEVEGEVVVNSLRYIASTENGIKMDENGLTPSSLSSVKAENGKSNPPAAQAQGKPATAQEGSAGRDASVGGSDSPGSAAPPQEENDGTKWTAENFAKAWPLVVRWNPEFEPDKVPPEDKWHPLLVADFREVLKRVTPLQCHEIIAYSQWKPQASYNKTTANIVKNASGHLKFVETVKRKPLWEGIWTRYVNMVNGLPPKGNPDMSDFDIEAPEDDLYTTAKSSSNLEDEDE